MTVETHGFNTIDKLSKVPKGGPRSCQCITVGKLHWPLLALKLEAKGRESKNYRSSLKIENDQNQDCT